MSVKRIPKAVRAMAWVCGPSINRIAGSNPAESTDVRLLCVVNVAAFAKS